MSAAPATPSTPSGVAMIHPAGTARHSGRWAEAGLLGIALVIGLGGFVLTAINRTGSSPAQVLQLGGALVLIALVVHLWVRFTAPWADPVILPTAVALNGVGLAMIQRLDLSYERSGQMQYLVGNKQLVWTVLGVILFCAVLFLLRDHRRLRRWDNWAMWVGLVFLVLPFMPFLGREINGARIWISLGPMSFQPAELSKVLLAVFFASFLVSNRDNLALAGRRVLWMNLPRARHLIPLLVVWGVSIAVLVLQKDLGSSVLLFGLFVVVLYVATDRPSWLLIGAGLFLPAAWFAATQLNHVQQRINGWLNAMDPEVYNAGGGSWQLVTGLFGLASGGLLGTGWGKGYPNLVTFANSDFIVAALGEELGLTGSLAILALYLVLIERGLRTAMTLRDGFGKLLATGLSFTIALQVFVVVGGVTRLIPLTGLTTPFLAYGGSSLISNWIILALLLRLSDAARRPASQAPRIIDTAELPVSLRKQVQSADAGLLAADAQDSADPDPSGPSGALGAHESGESWDSPADDIDDDYDDAVPLADGPAGGSGGHGRGGAATTPGMAGAAGHGPAPAPRASEHPTEAVSMPAGAVGPVDPAAPAHLPGPPDPPGPASWPQAPLPPAPQPGAAPAPTARPEGEEHA